jgi:hypothetical protein
VFSLVLYMIIVVQSNVRGIDRGVEPPLSLIIAALSGVALVFLAAGWITRRHRFILAGLALVVLTFSTRAAFIQMVNPWDNAVWFSIANVLAAAGAYVLEYRGRLYESQV